MRPLAALLDGAALSEGTPVAVARVVRDGAIEEAVAGWWPDGAAVAPDDRFYGASLTKQVTGAAVAVLVRAGRLDPDMPVWSFVDDLPAWASTVTVRHLLHHTAGLWPAGEAEASTGTNDWTDERAMAAARWLADLTTRPGAAFKYSNVGYVLLAQIVSAIARRPLAAFVDQALLRPLGIEGMAFAGSDPSAFRQAPLLGPRRPLSHGDGGLWTTARAFAGWLHAQNEDRLGIAPLVTAPGRLNDGSPVDYGWGIGLRTRRNGPLYVHGGGWTGAVSKAVRSPRNGVSVVALAAGGTAEMIDAIVSAALGDATA